MTGMDRAPRHTLGIRELLSPEGFDRAGEFGGSGASATSGDGEPPIVDDTVISGVCLDSRDVEPGDLYVAIGGATTHGIHHALDAVRRGAAAVTIDPADIVSFEPEAAAALEALLEEGVPIVEVPALASRAPDIASRFHGYPDRALTIVAVTGTDGKTSVCRFVAEALSMLGASCGYIGTIGWGMGDSLGETTLTTPDALALRRMLAALRREGARAVALEASSHALASERLAGLDIDVAVLTNLGRDHLDFHGDVDAYRAAKARLFDWASLSAVVLNGDDAFGRELSARLADERADVERTVYRARAGESDGSPAGAEPSSAERSAPSVRQIAARDVRTDMGGLSFTLVDGEETHRVVSSLAGRFNVDNLLACHGVLRSFGYEAAVAAGALARLAPVAGRMERFSAAAESGSRPMVIVDYAHTPQALAAALSAARDHCTGELWVVFGCGGDRDQGKRAPMGRAAEAADHIVVTDDNPRREASADIIEAVLGGMRDRDRAEVVPDRASAIAYAVRAAGEGDVVLVAGKGHEDYQIVGERRLALSDRVCVHELLAEAC